jgi:tRNA modification GTPase
MDLISAEGEGAARAALAARDGVLFRSLSGYSEQLLHLSAHLAAWSDYPEEDVEELEETALKEQIGRLITGLQGLLDSFSTAMMLKKGIRTSIVGSPNVGKSTLMNYLSKEEKSIVTEIPGTTRDLIESTISLSNGMTLSLTDTAGLRETTDPVETIGVEKTRLRMQQSQLILVMIDATKPLSEQEEEILRETEAFPAIILVNKTDLSDRVYEELHTLSRHPVVYLSAKTGEGVDQLEKTILEELDLGHVDFSAPMIANERQKACVESAIRALREAEESLLEQMTLDAVGISLEEALRELLSLEGKEVSESLIEDVFARFCVGK